MHEGVVTIRVQHKQSLLKQHINCLPSGALDHEFSARLTEDRRCIVDESACVSFDAKIDTALRISSRRPLSNRYVMAFRR